MRRQEANRGRGRRARQGFTLVEIAIVIVIIGAIMAATLIGIGPVLESSKRSQTNRKLDRIELALLAYVMRNGCLPCPADGNLATGSATGDAGWSDANGVYYGPNGPANQPCAGTKCSANAVSRGVVPWNTLGIREADVTDAWNDRIEYAVDSSLVVTAGSSMVRTLPANYPAGAITVNNRAGASQSSTAAYVLVSSGPDRWHAYAAGSGDQITSGNSGQTAQTENDPSVAGATFVQDQPHLIKDGDYFDDVVRYRTAPAIIADCGSNACGNPA